MEVWVEHLMTSYKKEWNEGEACPMCGASWEHMDHCEDRDYYWYCPCCDSEIEAA